jgi:hypothetical protein
VNAVGRRRRVAAALAFALAALAMAGPPARADDPVALSEDVRQGLLGMQEALRDDLRLRAALDRLASDVNPIPVEQAAARESIWTPDKEKDAEPKKLWTPGSEER